MDAENSFLGSTDVLPTYDLEHCASNTTQCIKKSIYIYISSSLGRSRRTTQSIVVVEKDFWTYDGYI